MAKHYVPIKDIAEHFAVSISTLRTWKRDGTIPKDTYIKVGSCYRYCLDDVTAALLEEETVAIEDSTHDVEFVDLDDDF